MIVWIIYTQCASRFYSTQVSWKLGCSDNGLILSRARNASQIYEITLPQGGVFHCINASHSVNTSINGKFVWIVGYPWLGSCFETRTKGKDRERLQCCRKWQTHEYTWAIGFGGYGDPSEFFLSIFCNIVWIIVRAWCQSGRMLGFGFKNIPQRLSLIIS